MQQEKPRVGQVFNPCRNVCGFYPPDIVGRQLDLTDGQKRLYERLVRWAGTKGTCWHSFETTAAALGKCVRQIKSDMRTLERRRLVSHRVRGWKDGKRQTNVYSFRWHEMFDSRSESPAPEEEVGGNPLPSTPTVECSPLHATPESWVQDSAELSAIYGKSCVQPTAQEFRKRNYVRESSSAEISQEEKPKMIWTPEQLENARQVLGEHRGRGDQPDSVITRKILGKFDSMEDFSTWIEEIRQRLSPSQIKGSGYGLYPKDAERWADSLRQQRKRERDAQAEYDRVMNTATDPENAVKLAEEHQSRIRGWYRIPDGLRSRLLRRAVPIAPVAVIGLAKSLCDACDESGITGSALRRTLKFCSCKAGAERKEQNGSDWPAQEVARVHSTLQGRLVGALQELGHTYLADAVEHSEVEDGQTLIVHPNRGYRIHFEDRTMPGAIQQAFELLGEQPRQLTVPPKESPTLVEFPKTA
jgi:hypothetical protein